MSSIRNPRAARGFKTEIADASLEIEELPHDIERRKAAGEDTSDDEAKLDQLLHAQAERIVARITKNTAGGR